MLRWESGFITTTGRGIVTPGINLAMYQGKWMIQRGRGRRQYRGIEMFIKEEGIRDRVWGYRTYLFVYDWNYNQQLKELVVTLSLTLSSRLVTGTRYKSLTLPFAWPYSKREQFYSENLLYVTTFYRKSTFVEDNHDRLFWLNKLIWISFRSSAGTLDLCSSPFCCCVLCPIKVIPGGDASVSYAANARSTVELLLTAENIMPWSV
jgi:hypothetical protein